MLSSRGVRFVIKSRVKRADIVERQAMVVNFGMDPNVVAVGQTPTAKLGTATIALIETCAKVSVPVVQLKCAGSI